MNYHKVEILDTTLREGEQTPGVCFSVDEKLRIAGLLDQFGVEYLEAGHPSVSQDIFEGVQALASQGYRARVVAHARARQSDIDDVLRTGADSIGMFFSVRDERLNGHFKKSLEYVIDRVCE